MFWIYTGLKVWIKMWRQWVFIVFPRKCLVIFSVMDHVMPLPHKGICTVTGSSIIIIKLQIGVNGLRRRFIWGLPLEHMQVVWFLQNKTAKNREKQVGNLSTACVAPFNVAPNWNQMNIKALFVGGDRGVHWNIQCLSVFTGLPIPTYIFESQVVILWQFYSINDIKVIAVFILHFYCHVKEDGSLQAHWGNYWLSVYFFV